MERANSIRAVAIFGALTALNAAAHSGTESCRLGKLAEVLVTMEGRRPVIGAKVNGADALFEIDSGAFWSSITMAAAKQYGLRVNPYGLDGMYVVGIGGVSYPGVATVKEFTIFNAPAHNVDFLVFSSNISSGTVGLIGQNILRLADIEYDLAHSVIRFFKPEHCEHSDLAYWAKPGDAYSLMKIEQTSLSSPHTVGEAYLNGKGINVMFDSGAAASLVSVRAAKRVGITPQSPGATPTGVMATGTGRQAVPTWVAEFESFKVGDEEIKHAHLRFGEIADAETDMLLGADFFLSHRIYVSNSQHKLYFTYNGGPVFDIRPRRDSAQPTQGAAPAAAQGAAPVAPGERAPSSAAEPEAEPTDAAAWARRAAASAARMDLDHALADLTRASELAPGEPSYVFQRARLHYQRGETEQALNDINGTLQLQPNHVEALIARATMRLGAHDVAAAIIDLDAADRAAPKSAEARLELANLYSEAGRPELAIAQFDQWIDVNRDDVRLPSGLNGRCWARALTGRDLDLALEDCDAAIRRVPKFGALLDSRGLVYLRQGKFDKAIADYNAALAQNPKIPWSLYGRGIARLRKGLKDEGEADLAAAKAIAPQIADEAGRYGIAP